MNAATAAVIKRIPGGIADITLPLGVQMETRPREACYDWIDRECCLYQGRAWLDIQGPPTRLVLVRCPMCGDIRSFYTELSSEMQRHMLRQGWQAWLDGYKD